MEKERGEEDGKAPMFIFQDYGRHELVYAYTISYLVTRGGRSRVTPACHSRAAEDFQMSLSSPSSINQGTDRAESVQCSRGLEG